MRFQPTQTVNFIFWSLFRASQIAKKSVLAFPVSRCKDSGHAKACTPNGHGLLVPHSVEAVGGVHPLWVHHIQVRFPDNLGCQQNPLFEVGCGFYQILMGLIAMKIWVTELGRAWLGSVWYF